jgi:tetratricopeptide (TPR) repeat protein
MQARAAAYGFRGRAYYVKGDHDRAVHDFDDALRLNPKERLPRPHIDISVLFRAY